MNSTTSNIPIASIATLPPAPNSCLSAADCSMRGDCIELQCYCYEYWAGHDCGKSYAQLLGDQWSIYLIGFIAAGTLVAAFALVQLFRSCFASRSMNYWKGIHLLLLLEGIVHMTELGLAPSKSNAFVTPPWLRGLLAGVGVYVILAILCSIVLYWCQFYARVFINDPNTELKRVQVFYKSLLLVFFLVEMGFRLAYFVFPNYGAWSVAHSVVICICCTITAGTFFVVGRRLHSRLSSTNGNAFRRQLSKTRYLTVGASVLLLLTVFAVAAMAILGAILHNELHRPTRYLMQQVVYRSFQFIYCGFILIVLRTPPELAQRAMYKALG